MNAAHEGDVLAWIDVETTGLNAHWDQLLEVACILTDTALNELAEPFHRVIEYDEFETEVMRSEVDDFVREMHDTTGLWQRLQSGTPLRTVDNQLEEHIRSVAPNKRQARVAGNSVRLDLNFLEQYLPSTYNHLHYRSVDVTGLEFMLEQWVGLEPQGSDNRNHDALSDIRASIEQARSARDRLEGMVYSL